MLQCRSFRGWKQTWEFTQVVVNDSKGAERAGKEEDEGDRLKNSCISSHLPYWLDFQSPQPSKSNMMPEIISPLFALQAEDRLKVVPHVHIRAWKICKGRWKCHPKEREMQKEERSLEVYAIKYYCGRMHWPPNNSFWNLKHKEQTKRQMFTRTLTWDLKNKVRR